MTYTWQRWLKDWREIADKSSPTAYTLIVVHVDGKDYEVLRVSKFQQDYDGDKEYVETSIREFNDKKAIYSRATRDLGTVRVITYNHKPKFVIEPGSEVLELHAFLEGTTVKQLMKVIRASDLGRRVRQRDRRAEKKSKENEKKYLQQIAEITLEKDEAITKINIAELDKIEAVKKKNIAELEIIKAKKDLEQVNKKLINQNEKLLQQGIVFPGSDTMACPLGKAREEGYELRSTKPLPGNFEG